MADIPKVKIAVLGGSTTIGANFPRAYEGVNIIADGLVFDTPFGQTASFTHAEVDGKEFLYVDFHGINRQVRNTEPNSSGERVFYVLWKAGVRKVIGTALCGSTNRLLDPANVVIPDDFVDARAGVELVSNYGEGLIEPRWEGNTAFRDFQKKWSGPASEAILGALRVMDPDDDSCGCGTYRWESILL